MRYKTIEEIQNLFSSSAKIIQEIYVLQFENPVELLKHFKLTGVNGIKNNEFGVLKIRKCMEILDKEYQNKLTYKPVYIVD